MFGTRWVDIIEGDEDAPYCWTRFVVQEYKRQADWSFFTGTPPLEALRSIPICATNEELPNDVGQPVAWTELVALMLIDVRRAHFYCAARRKVFVELPAEACTDKNEKHVWLPRRWSELGIRSLPGHDCSWFCARLSIALHLLPFGGGNSVCGYTETTVYPSVTSSM